MRTGDPDVDGGVGPVTAGLRRALLDVQYGRTPDTRGWLTRLACLRRKIFGVTA